jgi:hypothetical protein
LLEFYKGKISEIKSVTRMCQSTAWVVKNHMKDAHVLYRATRPDDVNTTITEAFTLMAARTYTKAYISYMT